jgi:hypothetical protein
VEGGGSLPTELLGGALEAVAHGLSTARQHLERAAGQLAALQGAAPWSQALLAAADACLHSERWHAAWHAEAAGGKEAYARTVALARDMLKQDLLPLLCDAAAQQTGASGFCLAPQYQALLAMGGCGLPLPGGRAGQRAAHQLAPAVAALLSREAARSRLRLAWQPSAFCFWLFQALKPARPALPPLACLQGAPPLRLWGCATPATAAPGCETFRCSTCCGTAFNACGLQCQRMPAPTWSARVGLTRLHNL